MGHRAIVAYEKNDEMYSLHYSHRGAFEYRLREEITESHPFGKGSNETWATETIDSIRSGEPIEQYPIEEHSGSTSVEPSPKDSAASLEEIANTVVNYLHYEAVYVVSINWDVEVWIPLWTGLSYESGRIETADVIGNGVLVAQTKQNPVCLDHQDLLKKWSILKEILGEGIDNSWITPGEASSYLQSKVADWTRPNTTLLFTDNWSVGSIRSSE